MEFIEREMILITKWFNAVQDINRNYLTKEDYELVLKMYKHRGLRVPNEIRDGLKVKPQTRREIDHE